MMVDHAPATKGANEDDRNLPVYVAEDHEHEEDAGGGDKESGRTALTVEGEDEKGIVRLQRKR